MAAIVIALMMFAMVLCSLIMVYILNYRTTHHRAFDLIAWNSRCEADWRRAFSAFKTGVPCFLLNLALLAWVQFQRYQAAAIAVTLVSLAAVFIWLWYVNVKWALTVR